MTLEIDRGEHPGEPPAHDHGGDLLVDGLPGEPRLDEWISVEVFAQLDPLTHAIGPESLLLLLRVALPHLVHGQGRS